MKFSSLLVLLFFFVTSQTVAQKVGHIHSEEVLSKMPEYIEALEEIDLLTKNWESEILQKQKELEKMKHDYLSDKPMLTLTMEEEMLGQIEVLENELREYQNKRFGYEGMLYLKREQLIEPVKAKMSEAVERVSKKNKVDFMFDLSADMVLPYASKGRNYTTKVLEQLGVVVSE
ncbi:OmpH family outer membrane protein [Flammeovirgaceae bacterium SG7u.111]|nr:OmpH family outer membrane protein [Flammeovirgaceae bacterium SG7u.132]WPO33449.1 OmpH family outer membrane protein [Flammeovirgaceae bacterium SG7u.111]